MLQDAEGEGTFERYNVRGMPCRWDAARDSMVKYHEMHKTSALKYVALRQKDIMEVCIVFCCVVLPLKNLHDGSHNSPKI